MDKLYNVREIFKSVASNYDLMNDIMSFGIHRYWKDCLVGLLEHRLINHWQRVQKYTYGYNKNQFSRYKFPALNIVDLAGGTGDVAFRVNELSNYLAYKCPGGFIHHNDISKYNPKITIIDPSEEMINHGKNRLKNHNLTLNTSNQFNNIDWILGSAEKIPMEDSSVDVITIAFGARNFEDLSQGLSECNRILKPRGSLYILEFSKCELPFLSTFYSLYSQIIIPNMGKLVVGDRNAYQYLVDSIEAFPNQNDFAKIIKECGFINVQSLNLTGGIVAIHKALK